jgi:hypothetical protein
MQGGLQMPLSENRTSFTFNHADQVDEYGASVGNFDIVQTNFDSRAEQNLADINNIKTTLTSETVDDSGAHNIKSAGIAGILSGAAATVYAMLSALKSYIDTVAANFQLGALLDRSVTYIKIALGTITDAELSDVAGQIKDRLTTHEADGTAHGVGTHIEKNAIDAHAVIPSCRVSKSAHQSIADEQIVPITFDIEAFDTDSIHDNVTNNSRLTCKTAGKYIITGNIVYAVNATDFRSAIIRVNGATIINYANAQALTNVGVTSCISTTTIYDLAINDYVELCAYHSAGVALNVMLDTTNFAMVKVG